MLYKAHAFNDFLQKFIKILVFKLNYPEHEPGTPIVWLHFKLISNTLGNLQTT